MNPSDIYAVLQWWLVLFLLGVLFTPVTFRLFVPFFDKGYLFSKLIGTVAVGYVIFVLGITHAAPFTRITIIITAIILSLIFFFLYKQKWHIWFTLKHMWILFIIEEVLFLATLFVWAYIHSFAPEIHGLEKFMDYGFVNSLLRSEYFPPKDMWFPPYPINYYYFGHLLTALLTKLSGIPSYITFNLMLSTIVAYCFSLTFSLGANLYYHLTKTDKIDKVKLFLSGILTGFLVTFAGNLHIIYAFFQQYKTDNPIPFWQLAFKPFSFPNSYWYPNATRFIYHTIHEFPIYSWTVADLHGHVLDIPFVLLAMGFLLSLLLLHNTRENEKITIRQTFQIHPVYLIALGLLLSAMYMTNAWDGAIYWLLSAMTILTIHGHLLPFYRNVYAEEAMPFEVIANNKREPTRIRSLQGWQITWGRDLVLSLLVVTASLFLFATPYNLFFNTSVYNHGIGVLCAPDFLTNIGRIGPFIFEPSHCQRSYWWEIITLYGFFFYFAIALGIFIFRSKRHTITDTFVALLVVLSLLLIFIPEFFYLKDIYPTYYRANTMFKLVFQAFIMLSISSAYTIVRMIMIIPYQQKKQRVITFGFLLISAALVCLVMLYPYLAVNSYYGNFKNYQGLNGINYLKTLYPDDYAAIMWMNNNIKGQPVILEAQGDSYTDYERISANTGLPTVLGWTVHEWLWRGSYDVPAPRITEVKTIYETTDTRVAKTLLAKYDVKYVFVGTLEFQKYPQLDELKFKTLGKIIYQHGTVRIYQLH